MANEEYLKQILYMDLPQEDPKTELVRSRKAALFPESKKQIENLGERLRAARVRRGMTMEEMAERSGLSRPTLSALEQGSPSVAIAAYIAVLNILGMVGDLAFVAANDNLGQMIELTNIRKVKRVRHKKEK